MWLEWWIRHKFHIDQLALSIFGLCYHKYWQSERNNNMKKKQNNENKINESIINSMASSGLHACVLKTKYNSIFWLNRPARPKWHECGVCVLSKYAHLLSTSLPLHLLQSIYLSMHIHSARYSCVTIDFNCIINNCIWVLISC